MTAMPTPDERRCASPKNNGHECNVPADLLVEDEEQPGTWYCFGHAPWLEEARDAARFKAGSRTALKYRRAPRFLDERDLGALITPADALRWSQVIAGATATGRLSSSAASVALKALESWVKAHEAVDVTARLEQLEATVARQQREREAAQRRQPPRYLGRDT